MDIKRKAKYIPVVLLYAYLPAFIGMEEAFEHCGTKGVVIIMAGWTIILIVIAALFYRPQN